MEESNQPQDLLGIKDFGVATKVIAVGLVDGAKAFLGRVCLPAAEEFGLMLRDNVHAWRLNNTAKILNKANELSNLNPEIANSKIHPRLARVALEEGSWNDQEEIQDLWAGLLASGTSLDGASDENLIFMNILKQLTSLQVIILNHCIKEANKFDTGYGLPSAEYFVLTIDEVKRISKCSDLQRLDRELDHLSELGLIDGGINLESNSVTLTPTALSIHLFVRAKGSKESPVSFFKLSKKIRNVINNDLSTKRIKEPIFAKRQSDNITKIREVMIDKIMKKAPMKMDIKIPDKEELKNASLIDLIQISRLLSVKVPIEIAMMNGLNDIPFVDDPEWKQKQALKNIEELELVIKEFSKH